MRGRRALIATAASILLIVIAIFKSTTSSRNLDALSYTVQYRYPYVKPSPLPWNPPSPKGQGTDPVVERLILQVQTESEDQLWVDKMLPTWSKEVITINNDFAKLHADGKTVDKGRVANAYLTWIIENYNNLPETVVFLPPSLQQQEHGLFSRDAIASLQIPHIQSSGFATLHCPSAAICKTLINPFRFPPDKLRTLEVSMKEAWNGIFGNVTIPEDLATPPTAEFVVSREQVKKREWKQYLRAWTWLNRTIMDDDSGGRVLEYVWHVLFGQEAEFCPDFRECECSNFGRC